MAKSDRSVALGKKKRHGLAYDIAPSNDDTAFTGDLNAIVIHKSNYSGRSTWKKLVVSYHNPAHICGVKGVNVLLGRDPADYAILVNGFWKRKLNQDAIYAVVFIKLVNFCYQFSLGYIGGKLNLI